MSGFLLRGNVFIQQVSSTGMPIGGITGPINAESLEFSPDSEQIIRDSKNKKTYGKSLGTVTTSKPSTVKLKFDEISTKIIAAMLGSVVTELNTAAASKIDEPITLLENGDWVFIGNKQIVADGLDAAKGAEELKYGVDYEINYALGLIRQTKNGKVKDGGEITLTYTSLARAGDRIVGGQVVHPEWRIMLEGENIDTGASVQFEVPHASLQSTTALNLVQNEFLSPEFEGTANVPEGQEVDFTYEEVSAT